MIIRTQLRSDGRLFTWKVAETAEERKRAGLSVKKTRISARRREQLEALEERVTTVDREIRTGVMDRHRTWQSIMSDREQAGVKPLDPTPKKKGQDKGIKQAYAFRSQR